MAKSETQNRAKSQANPLTEQEQQTLQLLQSFSRDSRQTIKKPIRPQFGNRYVAPPSS